MTRMREVTKLLSNFSSLLQAIYFKVIWHNFLNFYTVCNKGQHLSKRKRDDYWFDSHSSNDYIYLIYIHHHPLVDKARR